MSFEFVIRLIGMVVMAVFSFQFAVSLGGTWSDVRIISALVLAGAALGLLVSPLVTIRPIVWISNRINSLSSSQLFAGLVGLILGLAIAALMTPALSNLPSPFGEVLPFVASILFGYLGMIILVRRHREISDFVSARLVREGMVRRGARARESDVVLLDTSVIIDGRIADISRTGFIGETMLVPRFVLDELQHIADSPDPLRRNRGRRGLDMLNKLQKESVVPIVITDMDVEEVREVDSKLVMLAKKLRCPIITNDYNLNRVAELQGVMVLNINELTNAVRVILLPGETLQVRVIQEGKEPGQGVGYLDDGTMVVVENGKRYLNQTIEATVTKVLQTAAGRMIFAQPITN
ncbi:MAG: PIN/TRAM domain-containing protein [Anaerolineae bacterium]